MLQSKGLKNWACRYPLRDFLILYHESCAGARLFNELQKNRRFRGFASPAGAENGLFSHDFH